MLVKKNKNNSFLFFTLACLGVLILLAFTKGSSNNAIKIIPEIAQNTNYKSIQIVLKEKHYKKIKRKRNKALTVGVLQTEDDDFVPASVIYNNETFKANVRLKGDWSEHLEGLKWSFRVKLDGDRTIRGMRKFSIHHPSSRGYLNEWLYHKAIKQEGIMGLRYGFLEGFIHVRLKEADTALTRNVGIYAMEETFDKRLIENNKRKPGIILKLTEGDMWRELAKTHELGKVTGTGVSDKYNRRYGKSDDMTVTAYSLSKILGDDILKKQFVLSKNLLNKLKNNRLKISQVFDIEKTAKYTAIANLFGGSHGLTTHNLRFYYNPITSLIEPIAFDGNSGLKLPKFKYYWKSSGDTVFVKQLILALEKVCEPSYIDNLLKNYEVDLNALNADMKLEFKNEPILSIDILRENQEILRKTMLSLKANQKL